MEGRCLSGSWAPRRGGRKTTNRLRAIETILNDYDYLTVIVVARQRIACGRLKLRFTHEGELQTGEVARQRIACGRLKRAPAGGYDLTCLRRKTTNRLRAIETNSSAPLNKNVASVARQRIACGRLKLRTVADHDHRLFRSQDNESPAGD